jgi:hypothetical protein
VESVAYTPRRILEQIKGISEQKATKVLIEGMYNIGTVADISDLDSIKACSDGLYHCYRDASTEKRVDIHHYGI